MYVYESRQEGDLRETKQFAREQGGATRRRGGRRVRATADAPLAHGAGARRRPTLTGMDR